MTAEIGLTTKGFSDNEDTDTQHVTQQSPHTTLPNSTSGQVESDLQFLEPSGEAVGSSDDVISTTSNEVPLVLDHSVGDKKEEVLLASAENSPPPWWNEWELPEGETPSATTSSVASTRKTSHMYTQSPETVVDPNSESAANYQSDSPTDTYFLVSEEALCAASLKKIVMFLQLETASRNSSTFLKMVIIIVIYKSVKLANSTITTGYAKINMAEISISLYISRISEQY